MSLRQRADEPRIRVLVVDGDERVRGALRTLFDTQSDMQVVGEAASGEEAVDDVARLDPDVVLMDCRAAAALNAVPVTRAATRSTRKPRIVLLMMAAGPDAESSGVDKVIFKGCASETLLKSLRQVLRTRPGGAEPTAPNPKPSRES